MCDLPGTQSPPSSFPLTPINEEINMPWGRLISLLQELDPVDLVNTTLKLGRSEECDIVLHKSKFPANVLLNVSKEHFTITKVMDGPVYITDLSKNGTYVNKERVGKNKKYILQNNDIISVGHREMSIYIFKHMFSHDERYLPPELRKKYEAGTFLGRGAVGEVRLLYEKTTCRKFAVKKITKGTFNTSNMHKLNHPNKIYTEIEILTNIKHPCVIGMKDIVETENEVFIVLEYMEGGELTTRILKSNITESQAKFYFYQMVLAVGHLHSKGITHRDLKPENVLLSSKSNECLIKVSDFGLSKVTDDNIMMTMCGTPNYVAPEVLDGTSRQYTNQVDVWSLGVILFFMISKQLPFISADRNKLGIKIMTGDYSFKGPQWSGTSAYVKDLIQKMLCLNPKNRITIQQILTHPWIQNDVGVQYKVHTLMQNTQLELETPMQICGPSPKRFRPEINT